MKGLTTLAAAGAGDTVPQFQTNSRLHIPVAEEDLFMRRISTIVLTCFPFPLAQTRRDAAQAIHRQGTAENGEKGLARNG
jgi:hypothetical protein